MAKHNLAVKTVENEMRLGERVSENLKTDPHDRYSELTEYMSQLNKYPVLKDQDEYDELFARYHAGDMAARDLIVYGNVRLVISIALRYTGRGLPLLDMIQEGMIGIFDSAIPKFDPTRGNRFSTYATYWIRQSITRALVDINERAAVRIPVHYHETLQAIRKALATLRKELGVWPNDLQVYERLQQSESKKAKELTLVDVVRIRRAIESGEPIRLDAPVSEDSDESMMDFVCSSPPKTETVIEARRLLVQYKQALARIEECIAQLPPRKAMVLQLRFGIGEFEAMTLQEVGDRYELTRERIRQIEVNALQHLKTQLNVTPEQIQEIIDVTQELEGIAHAI